MAAATSTFISFTSGLTFPSHPWEGHKQGGNHAEAPQGLTLRESWTRVSRLGDGVEADPGLVGKPGDPLGTHHRRKGVKHAPQTPGRHHRHIVHDDLAPGDLGAMNGHGTHHHSGVDRDLGGLVRLVVNRAQRGVERIAAMPQPPRPSSSSGP
jgi:hypothetical protein